MVHVIYKSRKKPVVDDKGLFNPNAFQQQTEREVEVQKTRKPWKKPDEKVKIDIKDGHFVTPEGDNVNIVNGCVVLKKEKTA